MSIAQLVGVVAHRRKLVDRPSTLFQARARTLYVTPDLDAYTQPPFADTLCGERFAAVAQFFDAFCELNMITVSENPDRKPPDVMMARVKPVEDEFWSMRITEPDETAGVRVFGGFCGQDAFVALTWDFRENINDFDAEIEGVQETWRDYFGSVGPYSGRSLDDYLTNYDEQ